MIIGRLKNARYFYISFLCFIALGFSYFVFQPHGTFLLWVNGHHTLFLSSFFKYWTHLGHGVSFATIALVLLFTNKRFGLVLVLVGFIQAGLAALLKQLIFKEIPRPKKFFEGERFLNFVEGVQVHEYHSFPSGHTMTAFAIACFLALMLQRNRYAIVLFWGALMVGLSRIYLVQHFLVDVMAGALMGTIMSTVLYMSFEKYLNRENRYKPPSAEESLSQMDLSTDDVQ